MNVTMREVARQAGVSIATVSRVLNGSGPVGDTTRAHIEQVARSLRYVPNRAARSLSTARTHTLGVVLPDLYGAFYSELLFGLDRAARGLHYHLLVAGAHGGDDELASALQAMNGRVDGLVVMSADISAELLEANLPPALPAVLLGGEARGYGALRVDNEGGAAAMTRHLLGLGHRRIAHVAGAAGNRDAAERLAGFQAAMHEAGLPDGPVVTGDFTESGGYAAMRRLLAEALPGGGPPIDAVFAANDAMALGALQALREAGLRVPEDVALGGFDDVPLGQYLTPPLTSVRVPLDVLGRRAVERLHAAADGAADASDGPEILPTTLVIRGSCGAPVASA
ncbi:MAG TPA: LacI family DNA-binding transcriptional regulator [Rhodothermales bacterium]|nr:LacI family DNA-binding transcriptional regulator [Rhodothermales bacterium]